MQCCLIYKINKWIASDKGKKDKKIKTIFNKIIENHTIFNGKIPPFFNKKITHDEWVKIKKSTSDFNDCYIDIPSDTIKNLYSIFGCKYIQISELGLYHLGTDICNFDIPEFICDQQLRIRTKIHNINKNGYCSLSVMAACQPKKIDNLTISKFSLDDKNKLPLNLEFID